MADNIKFSAEPGAYERHLQRKVNNPLFPESDQQLLAAEVDQAREKDQQDLRAFLDSFQETVKEAATLDHSVDSDIVLDLKERLERLYVSSASLAGDLDTYQQALLKLIDICMASIRRGAEDDPVAQKKIDEEIQARRIYFKLLDTPLVADLMRGDEIVSADDLIPTLLTQADAELVNTLELFEAEHLELILQQAREHLDILHPRLTDTRDIEKRIELIEKVVRHHTSS
jgi:hypothetical protein